jgi:acyl carrier protein
MTDAEIRERLRTYMLDNLIAEEDAGSLDDQTELITGGILDSLATLNLVSFLKKEFGVSLKAHEIDARTMDTIADMASLVSSRMG